MTSVSDTNPTPKPLPAVAGGRVDPAFRTVDVEPSRRVYVPDFRGLWEFRALLYFLTWRDLKVRYKQTILGPSWALLQPVLATAVFAVFFGRVAHVSSGGIPYLLYAFTGMLCWTFFANGVTNGSQSLVNAWTIVTKVYFPRAAMPIAAVLGCAVDMIFSAVTIIPLLAWYQVTPTLRLLALPVFFLLAALPTVGMALGLAGLNVRYRDVKYVVPFLVQVWLFASPVVYSAGSLGGVWKTLYELNPMVGVIEGFRWALVGTHPAPGIVTLISLATGTAIFVIGASYMSNVEQVMADVI